MSVSELQFLNRVIEDKSFSAVLDYQLSEDNFVEFKDEFNYLNDYFEKYNTLPDKESIIDKFNDFRVFKVEEPIDAIVSKIREEKLFRDSLLVFNKASELISVDANKGVEYLRNAMAGLQVDYDMRYTDAVANAMSRYEDYEKRVNGEGIEFIPIALPELDEIYSGFAKGSLTSLVARISNGKSQLLSLFAEHCSANGYRTGFISPEMGKESILQRFDVAKSHLSAWSIYKGVPCPGYKNYIENLSKSDEYFVVSDYADFDNELTTSKVEIMIKTLKLDILFIDDIAYVEPVRTFRGMSEEWMLGQASKELLALAKKYNCAIVMTAQLNRRTADKENKGVISLENLAGSDKIGRISENVIALRQVDNCIELSVLKNRYGKKGQKLLYICDYDTLNFSFIPQLENMTEEEIQENEQTKEKIKGIF